MITNALKKFRSNTDCDDYYLTVTPLEVTSDLAAIGERRLLPNENINKVLDSYGVMSYLSNDRRGKKISRVNQADGTIKITLYMYDTPTINLRICYDNGDGINQWEKVVIKEGLGLDELVKMVVDVFGVSDNDGFRLYSLSAKVVIEKDNFKGLVETAKEKGQVLTMRLISINEVSTLSRNGSRRDPVRVKTLDPGRRSLDPGRQTPAPEKPPALQIASNSDVTLGESQALGFDDLLSVLDSSIMERSSTRTNPATPKLKQTFDDLEKDLESLISSQMRKSADQRRSGRLSMIQKRQELAPEIDSEKLFIALKESSTTLSRLEQNLNVMLGVILARNNLITVSS